MTRGMLLDSVALPHITKVSYPTEMQRDEQFYMTLVTLQVEDHLFRVPRQSLEFQSKIFRDMFSLPQAKNPEGSTDDNPIRLDGIKKDEFKRFLEVLFMSVPEETTKQSAAFETWFPIVKLAQMWEFDRIHRYAIKQMPYAQVRRNPVEMVSLAARYDIKPWLIPGLNELAKRPEPLGDSDLEFLGAELSLKVAAVRESVTYNRSIGTLTSGTRDASNVDFTAVIRRIFRISDYELT